MSDKTHRQAAPGTWYDTTVKSGPDPKHVCAARHGATGYLCTREPGHGPKKAPLHVAHTGADNGTALVEWTG